MRLRIHALLALADGGQCEGIAYRLSPELMRQELGLLWNREMLAGVYKPRWVPTKLPCMPAARRWRRWGASRSSPRRPRA